MTACCFSVASFLSLKARGLTHLNLHHCASSPGPVVAPKVGMRRRQKDIKASKPASLGTQEVQSESQHAIPFSFFL